MLAPGVTLSLTTISNGEAGSAGLCTAPFMNEKNTPGVFTQVADANVRAPRCGQCFGYVNKYCDITNSRWFCSLCGYRNVFSRQQSRYRNVDLRLLPELQDSVADYRLTLSDGAGGTLASPISSRPLVHLFFIQESLRFDSLQAVGEAITAAAVKLHPQVQIALVTFSSRIGVYRLSRYGATVQYVYFSRHCSSGEDAAMPIREVIHFMDVCTEVALCRDSFCAAVTSLFESSSDQSSHWQESDPDERAPVAVNSMLGPCLVAVGEWILRPPYNISSSSADPFDVPGQGLAPQSAVGRSGWNDDLLAFFGFGSAASGSADAYERNKENEKLSPASVCTGIFLHIFLDSSQGGLERSESDVDKNDFAVRHGIDAKSLRSLANQFAHSAVTVNIWAISNFGNDDLALSELEPLASVTGGHVYRCVLGLYPKDERIRLSESLSRTLSSKCATSGLLKVRSSSGLSQIPDGYSGPMVPDKSFDGVFRLASCSPQTTIGFELHLHGSDNETLCIQIAFTFETVVESESFVSDCGDLVSGGEHPHLSDSDIVGSVDSCSNSSSAAPFTGSVLGILEMDSGSKAVCFDKEGEYDVNKQLVVVKILRVITIAWQFDSKLDTNSFLGRIDIPTTVALLTRKAVQRSSVYRDSRDPPVTAAANGNSSESSSLEAEDGAESIMKIANMDDPGIRFLLNWCVAFLTRLVVEMQPREVGATFAATADSAMKIPDVDELLRFLFAAVDLITFHFQTGAATRSESPSADESAVFYNYCQRAEPTGLCALLYPQLFPLSRELCVAARPIRLCRQAMVMDGAPHYFLDAASEVVVYQATLHDQRLPSPPPLPAMVKSLPAAAAASNSSTEQSAPSRARGKKFVASVNSSKGATDACSAKKQQPLLVELGYRLTLGTCPPEVRRACAGFASAASFDKYLIEDISRSGISFPAFKALLCSMLSVGEEKDR